MLIDLELKETCARHKTELSRRDATINNVCGQHHLFHPFSFVCNHIFILLARITEINLVFCIFYELYLISVSCGLHLISDQDGCFCPVI